MLPDKDFLDYLNTCDERKKKLVLLNFNTKRDEVRRQLRAMLLVTDGCQIDYEALATELNCTRDEAFMEMFNIQVQSRREWGMSRAHRCFLHLLTPAVCR